MKAVMKRNVVMLFIFLLASTSVFAQRTIGLCLSGGGAKGAYEAGVWKYLEEQGLTQRIKAISGTSIGGINAVLFTCLSQNQTEQYWRDQIGPTTILTPDYAKWIVIKTGIKNFFNDTKETYQEYKEESPESKISPAAKTALTQGESVVENLFNYASIFGLSSEKSYGFFSRDELITAIDNSIPYKKLYDSTAPDIYVSVIKKDAIAFDYLDAKYATTKVNNTHVFKLQDQKQENIPLILCATSAVPIVFDSVTLPATVVENGIPVGSEAEYIDGGFEQVGGRNVNVVPLANDDDVQTIIVVFLKSRSDMHLSAKHQEELNKISKAEQAEHKAWENIVYPYINERDSKIAEIESQKNAALKALKDEKKINIANAKDENDNKIEQLKKAKEDADKKYDIEIKNATNKQTKKNIKEDKKKVDNDYDNQIAALKKDSKNDTKDLKSSYKVNKKEIEDIAKSREDEITKVYNVEISKYPEPQLHVEEREALMNRWKVDPEYERQEILDAQNEADGKKVIVIVPEQKMGNIFTGTANFTSSRMNELVTSGYEDAKSILEKENMLTVDTEETW